MSQTEIPPTQPAIPPDPIIHKSYALPVWLSMLAVVGATVLAVVDEMWLRRPYKKIQAQYRETYAPYLEKVEAKRRAFADNVLRETAEYKSLVEAEQAAARAVAPRRVAIEAQLETATRRARSLAVALKVANSEIAALTYRAEHEAHADEAADVLKSDDARETVQEILDVRKREITYSWEASVVGEPGENGVPQVTRKTETETGTVDALRAFALDLEIVKANLQQELVKVVQSATEAQARSAAWWKENLGNLQYALANADDATRAAIAETGVTRYIDEEVVALDPGAVGELRKGVEKYPKGLAAAFGGELKQIHIAEAANWVDRCETCHLNTRHPMPVTVESLRTVLGQTVQAPPAVPGEEARTLPAWDGSKIDSMPLGLFTSHPRMELLDAHDPERFGCSMCHNGNGVAVTSAHLAHGLNKHWLWPLYQREHMEAGCVQCHQMDLHLPMGERVTAGKNTFRHVGCWACHAYEGFNTEVNEIAVLTSRRDEILGLQREKQVRADNLRALVGALPEDASEVIDREGAKSQREQDTLAIERAELESERIRIGRRLSELYVERQRVGPNLKEMRVKLLEGFVTDWIRDPRDAHKDASGHPFRPDTKMPTFRWFDQPDEEVKDVAAFLWQSALDPAKYQADFARELPAFTPGDAKRGETLLRTRGCLACHAIGYGDEKIGSEYAANLSNLGEKNRPEWVARWINHPRRRLVGYDPTRPLRDRDVPNAAPDDPSIVWTQHTIMPNFRLDASEVRDITTFLTAQRRPDVNYEPAPWLTDQSRFDRGRKLVLFQGCAGCHEIAGLEEEKGIGTELTQEGSKPIERLDFGHHTIPAERGVETMKGVDLPEDQEKLFSEDRPWYRQRGFILHKIAKPDFYDVSKYLPDRFNRLRMPQFTLTAQELLDVTTFVLGSVDTKIPQTFRYDPEGRKKAIREGWWVVKKYNCQACHPIESDDRPDIWSVPGFRDVLGDNAKRDQTLPPNLVGVGFRLKPEALVNFLRDPSLGGGRERPVSTREHLAIRMPTFDFSDTEIQKLVLFFEALADQPAVYQPPVLQPLSDAELRAARAIFNANGSCAQCHIVEGQKPTSETKGPNLTFAPARLRADWAHRWIQDPPAIHPRTSMAKMFELKDGTWRFKSAVPMPEVEAVPGDHIALMVRYLLLGLAGK